MSVSDSGNEVLRKSAVVLDGGPDNHPDKGAEYVLRVASVADGPLSELVWDSWNIATTATTDIVTYYSGGLGGNAVATFTATYTNTRKKDVVSGVWAVI